MGLCFIGEATMSIYSKAKDLSIIALHPHLIVSRTKYLFLLSHMRSRSSVLSHVLGSNADVCGYRELHINYRNRVDLLQMRACLYGELSAEIEGKYLFDKILHDSHVVSDRLLDRIKPKVIFLLRKPEDTLKSIINMGHRASIEWCTIPEQATDYYCSRLSTLEAYAAGRGGQYFFIESDHLVEHTDEVLRQLTKWLQLYEPLKKNYSLFDNTGKPGFGDPLDHIRSGTVKKTTGYASITVPSDLLRKAEAAYEQCKTRLLKYSL